MPRCFATPLGVQRRAGACGLFLLPGTPGGGVDSGVDSFGLDAGGAGFVSVFGGESASFRFYGGGEEVSLGFSTAWSPAF